MSKPRFSRRRKGRKVDLYPLNESHPTASQRTKRSSRGRSRKAVHHPPTRVGKSELEEVLLPHFDTFREAAQHHKTEMAYTVAFDRQTGDTVLRGPSRGRKVGKATYQVYDPKVRGGEAKLGAWHSHPWERDAEFSDEDMRTFQASKDGSLFTMVSGWRGGEILTRDGQWYFFDYDYQDIRTSKEMLKTV